MSFFRSQLSDVIEWKEFREDMIFWKWDNNEIKKGSRLIIRPGQDAIFLHNGRIEGIFENEGDYDIESEIIPFLSTLKGFRFGFRTGMRAEILFVNTKEFTVKWGTRNPINIPTPALPGGLPIRANGTFHFKVNDYVALIDKIAGVRDSYLVENVRVRIVSALNQLLMKWITREGKDIFNLQAHTDEISRGIQDDLNMEVMDDGMKITGFHVNSFNYPKEVQERITESASHHMIGDVSKYQQVKMTDGMASGKMSGSGNASDMAGMMMGMNVANKVMKNMEQNESQQQQNQPNQQQAPQQNSQNNPPQEKQANGGNPNIPNFCPNCGQKTTGTNFCPNCGHKLA